MTSLRVKLQSASSHEAVEAALDALVGICQAVFVRKRSFLIRPQAVIATFTRAVDAFTVVRAFLDGAQVAGRGVIVSFVH